MERKLKYKCTVNLSLPAILLRRFSVKEMTQPKNPDNWKKVLQAFNNTQASLDANILLLVMVMYYTVIGVEVRLYIQSNGNLYTTYRTKITILLNNNFSAPICCYNGKVERTSEQH